MTESFNCEYRIAGAGIAGLLLASRLARSGRKVLVLDQGPSISEAERSNLLQGVRRDFAYGADYNDHLGAQTVTRTRPATDGEVAEYGYERLFGVGGTALHFQGLMLRPVEADMEVRSRFGYGRDWPISYDELESWLLEAEQEVGVAADEDNPYAARRSGPFPMSGHPFSWFDREMLAPALMKLGMTAHSCPHAVNSEPYRGRNPCLACRFCKFCPTGARYSPDRVQGQFLREQQNVTLITGTSLRRLDTSADGKRIVAAHARRIEEDDELVVRARKYIVDMGGVATPRVLLL